MLIEKSKNCRTSSFNRFGCLQIGNERDLFNRFTVKRSLEKTFFSFLGDKTLM